MSHSLIVDPGAENDILDGYLWYEQREAGLGVRFLQSIESVFDLIVENPMAYPVAVRPIRRAVTRTFPYLIFYLLDEESIHVLAVIHAAQDPEYIASRLDA